MVSIVDYNIGNIAAVVNMLQRIGIPSCVASRTEDIERADHIILPGNGAFDACMKNLRTSGLVPALQRQVLERGVPLLGICVGAQMLGNRSAEGIEPGLGWIDMQVERLPSIPGLRIPHMGWNQVQSMQEESPLSRGMEADSRFYFVHSYYMIPSNQSDVLFQANYGISFAAGVAHGQIAGVQFHPEKSHRFGKQLLTSFAGSI